MEDFLMKDFLMKDFLRRSRLKMTLKPPGKFVQFFLLLWILIERHYKKLTFSH